MLRGKWVEVDRERLTATLERLEAVERRAATEGVSFGRRCGSWRARDRREVEAQAAEPSWGRVEGRRLARRDARRCRRPEARGRPRARR